MKDRRQVRIIMPNHMPKLHNEDRTPPYYRTDNALEFKSQAAKNTYASYDITYQNNTPHQPQENPLAEKINLTLMNAARANLHHATLPTPSWEDAVRDAAFKYNIMPHSATAVAECGLMLYAIVCMADVPGHPPYTQWHVQPLKTCRLLTFGEIGTLPLLRPKKLDPRGTPVRYMYGK